MRRREGANVVLSPVSSRANSSGDRHIRGIRVVGVRTRPRNPDAQVAATLAFLSALEDEIAQAQLRGSISAVVIELGVEVEARHIDGIDITARGAVARFQRMLPDAGVHAPATELKVPDGTVPSAQVTHHGDKRPFGLIVGTGDDDFLVIGRELTLDFFAVLPTDHVGAARIRIVRI